MQNQIWREVHTITGFEGCIGYRVSNLGNAETCKRRIGDRINGGVQWDCLGLWRAMGLRRWCGRYRQLAMRDSGRQRMVKLHHLVLLAFSGERPSGMLGLHKDDNSENNRIDNLYWGTASQNQRDANRNGVANHPRGSKHGCAILTEEQVLIIRQRLKNGDVGIKIAKEFGVNKGTIYAINKRRIWAHLP